MLTVKGLSIQDPTGQTLVNSLDFSLNEGEILAILGESGSGKTLTSRSIIGLLSPQLATSGHILFEGTDLLSLSKKKLANLRGQKIAMSFQNTLANLNPLWTIHRQLKEPFHLHTDLTKEAIDQAITDLLLDVGLTEEVLPLYPHELSGGMRQRILIAMAMALKPKLLLADEPTSALDPNNRKLVLDLMTSMNKKYGTAILFVTHDIQSIKGFAHRLLVMKKGKIVESGLTENFLAHPQTVYGRQLLKQLPKKTPLSYKNTLPLLQIDQLDLALAYGKPSERVIFHQAQASFYPKKINTLLGPSGSGKSTLAKCLMGFIRPHQGRISFNQQVLFDGEKNIWLSADHPARPKLWQKMQLILQDPYASFDPKLRMDKTLELTLAHQSKYYGASSEDYLLCLLRQCELDQSDLYLYPKQLSGGKLQRLAIIRSLLRQPELLICDEITSSLDRATQIQVLDLLLRLQKEHHLTLLMITHDQEIVENLSDVTYELKDHQLFRID